MMTVELRENGDSTAPIRQLFLDEVQTDGQRRLLGTIVISEGRDADSGDVVVRAWTVIRPGHEDRVATFQGIAEALLAEALPDADRSAWNTPGTVKLGEIHNAVQVTELFVFAREAIPDVVEVAGAAYVAAKALKETAEASEAVARVVFKIRDAFRRKGDDERSSDGYL